jgi:hypothetical protein
MDDIGKGPSDNTEAPIMGEAANKILLTFEPIRRAAENAWRGVNSSHYP